MSRNPSIKKAFNASRGDLLCARPFIQDLYVAGGTTTGTVMLFPLQSTTKLRRLVGHRGAVTCLDASASYQCLASGSEDSTVRIWKIHDNDDSFINLEPNDGSINSISFSPNADKILTVGRLSSPSIFDPFDQSLIQKIEKHPAQINSVAMGINMAITASSDEICRIYDTRSNEKIRQINVFAPATAIALDRSDVNLVAGTFNGNMYLLDVGTGKIVKDSRPHSGTINSTMIQPGGNLIITCSDDHTVMIHDLETLETKFTLENHKDKVLDCAFSNWGSEFVTCGSDHRIMLWSSPVISNEPSDSEFEEEEEEEEIPSIDEVIPIKKPPTPEPEINSEQDRVSASLLDQSSEIQSPSKRTSRQPTAQHTTSSSNPTYTTNRPFSALSDTSSSSMCAKPPPKMKSVISVIKQDERAQSQPISIEDQQFQEVLVKASQAITEIEKTLVAMGRRMKSADEQITKLEHIQARQRSGKSSHRKRK